MDTTHIFPLSQVYEGLLLKMGEKGNDGGQFFTPREIIRAMVRVIDPQVGETVYDPGCGTGGFLAQSCEYMRAALGDESTGEQVETLRRRAFYGREKDNAIYPIALANLVLHDIDEPHIWHGNTLTMAETYGGLFAGAPALYDVVLMNPPFGAKEGREAQTRFPYKMGATQVLFLQHVIDSLKAGGRCGIVLDEGTMFRTTETAFVQTKRKLLDECELWCVVSLPGGVFTSAGAGLKTNLLFFTKGQPTERIWYCDLSDIKVGKKTPLTLGRFEEFLKLLPARAESDRSWTVDLAERKKGADEEARPFKDRAAKTRKAADRGKGELVMLRMAYPRDEQAVAALEERIRGLTVEAREAEGKAQGILDGVYDLKAVNPHARNEQDTRTPEELLDVIEAKAREMAEALRVLRER